jgi:hypothetical protein
MAKFVLSMQSLFTGKQNQREYPIQDQQRIIKWLYDENRRAVQSEFPEYSADDREFLVSGCTPEEWEELLGEEGIDE